MSNYRNVLAASIIALAVSAPAVADNNPSKERDDAPALSRFYPVAREAAKGLEESHTVYRPLNLRRFAPKSIPVIVWANGACRNSNLGFMIALTTLANHGFVVIANGAHDAEVPLVPPAGPGATVNPQNLVTAIEWVTRENDDVMSQFHNRLDSTKIGVAGQSCGGLEALVAGSDPRVKSIAAVNTGFFPEPTNGYGREQLANITVPTLVVNGGPTDVAYQNSIDTYNLLDNVPAYLAENTAAGHSGLWFGIRVNQQGNGEGNVPMANQGATLLVNWFDFSLNHNLAAGRYFFEPECGLCTQPDWKVQMKNW